MLANSGDPDAASDLGLHCWPLSLLWDARHKWIKTGLKNANLKWTVGIF